MAIWWALLKPKDLLKSEKTGFRLLLVWFLFILIFFSVAKAKLATYILPLFPAGALLIGRFLSSGFQADNKGFFQVLKWNFGIQFIFYLSLLISFPFILNTQNIQPILMDNNTITRFFLVSLGCAGLAWLSSCRHYLRMAILSAFIWPIIIFSASVLSAKDCISTYYSSKTLGSFLNQQKKLFSKVIYFKSIPKSLPFYTSIDVERAKEEKLLNLTQSDEPFLFLIRKNDFDDLDQKFFNKARPFKAIGKWWIYSN